MANCTVSGTFTDAQGNAISGATLRFNLDTPALDPTGSGNLLLPYEVTTTTSNSGTWSLSLIQGVSGVLTMDLVPTTMSPVIKYKFSLLIPSSASTTFASCWVDSSTFTGSATSPIVTFTDIAGQLQTSQLPTLVDTKVWIGVNGVATALPFSGDVTLADTGATTIVAVGTSTAANIHSAEQLANAATNSNIASTIVKRDGSGNFTAEAITATTVVASLIGTVTGHASQDLQASNNLSDLVSASAARINLGLGSAATSSVSSFLAPSNNLADVGNTASAFNTIVPMTTTGDTLYESAANTASRLAGNTTTTTKFLTQTGTGTGSAAPGWNAIAASDIAVAVSPGAIGNVLTSNGSTWTSTLPGSSPLVSAIANINAYYSLS